MRTRWSNGGASSGCMRSTASEMPASSRRLSAASALAFNSAVEKIAFDLMASASAFAAPSWPRSLAVNCGGAASFGSRLRRRSAHSYLALARQRHDRLRGEEGEHLSDVPVDRGRRHSAGELRPLEDAVLPRVNR